MVVSQAGSVHGHGQVSRVHKWSKRFISASTVASIVVLTQWFWDPLEEVAMAGAAPIEAVLSSMWGSFPRGVERVGIVKIDEARYWTLYSGTSPLSRCQMAQDVGRLAQVPGIQTIAIDFDLSPIGKDSVNEDCQRKLDAVVDANASRLVLMKPSIPEDDNKATILAWQGERINKGSSFGDVTIIQTRNFVRDYGPTGGAFPTLGLLVDERIRGKSNDSARLAPAEMSEHLSGRRIAFRVLGGLFNNGDDMNVDHPCLNADPRPVECSQLRTLFFGSGFTALDHFTTPYGVLDGVDIHAAIAACPNAGVSHFTLFLLEIALGMFILAPMFEKGWKRYFETVSGKAARMAGQQFALRQTGPRWRRRLAALIPTQPQAAYLWIVTIAAKAILVLLFAFLLVAVSSSLKECPVLEIPFGVVIGMFIDGAITSNVEVSSEELTTLQSEITVRGPLEVTDFSAVSQFDPHVFVKAILYLVLLTACLTKLFHFW